MIKLGNAWLRPDKILSIRVPKMVSEDADHWIEIDVEGVSYPLVVKDGMLKIDAEKLCDAYALHIDSLSYGNSNDLSGDTQTA